MIIKLVRRKESECVGAFLLIRPLCDSFGNRYRAVFSTVYIVVVRPLLKCTAMYVFTILMYRFFLTSTGEEEEKEAMCPILEDKQRVRSDRSSFEILLKTSVIASKPFQISSYSCIKIFDRKSRK